MKTITEFTGSSLQNALKTKRELLTAGKTAEELPAAMGEALKLDGDKLTLLLSALEVVEKKPHDLKRVVVWSLQEGEKAPRGTEQKGEHHFNIEYFPPMPGQQRGRHGKGHDDRDRDRKGGRRDRGGKKDGKGPRREGRPGGRPDRDGAKRRGEGAVSVVIINASGAASAGASAGAKPEGEGQEKKRRRRRRTPRGPRPEGGVSTAAPGTSTGVITPKGTTPQVTTPTKTGVITPRTVPLGPLAGPQLVPDAAKETSPASGEAGSEKEGV